MSSTTRHRVLARRWAGLLGALCLLSGPAGARQADTAHRIGRFATFENDSHFDTDRYYTDGIQFSIKQGADTRTPGPKALTRRFCAWLGCEDAQLLSIQTNFGQLIYTPGDITLPDPQPLDRPWAGLLYVGQVHALLSPDRRTLTTFAAEAGVTGRGALAEPSQKMVHRILDRPLPRGWDNQIGGTLALMVSAEQRTARDSLSFGLGGDVRLNTATYYRLALGNLMTYAAAGVAVVVGKDLPPVSPPPPGIGNQLAPELAGDTSCLKPWLQCTAFGSVETRLMGYNVFLDGRAFKEDPSVKRRNFVADLMLGLRLDFPHSRSASHGPWFLQFKVTRRSAEFRSSIPVPRHTFAAITLGTDF